MFLVPLLFILLVIWVLVYLLRAVASDSPSNTIHNNTAASSKPIEILKARYAKGDISEEEYLRIKKNLE